ncbi:hypothetical protein [Saccharospirillum mangrovi]|uniref:hypothetical protein n=1 Tax=Saccharospirillum mangrovi TaxID=2161747 RepID=UPI000D38B8DE|nr:hypothetical protein [Saccharospirillum mangrovi]
MDYQLIGKTLENAGKEIQKLNNKLDKILEKLLEVEAIEERKSEAVEHIQANRIGDAIELLKLVEKDQVKAETLKTEESELREQLEVAREQAAQAAAGKVDTETKGPHAVPDAESDAA